MQQSIPPYLTDWRVRRSGPSLTLTGRAGEALAKFTGVSSVTRVEGATHAEARNAAGAVVAHLA
jgi:hypothetical protein